MSAEQLSAPSGLPLSVTRQIDRLCDEFEAALSRGEGVDLAPYLNQVDGRGRAYLLQELAVLAVERLRSRGASDPWADLRAANPTLEQELAQPPRVSPTDRTVVHVSGGSGQDSGLVIRCPLCHSTITLVVDASLVDIACAHCGGRFSLLDDSALTRDARALTRVAHFELIDRLGMGEFGTVWKARDTILDRTVAIKLPRRAPLDAVAIEKFMREARAAAQLRHPNIVNTHEVGRNADSLYIVSDYIRGVSLADVTADQRLSVRESVTIAAKVADALDHAHRSGVIHRDLKPSNILIDDHGEPHLLDFGLAKRKDTEVTMTTDGVILGTPAYMSPEQARGESARVDGRSDTYSLGVILFQLLTGELPFRGSTRMLLHRVIHDEAPSLRSLESHVPRDLDTICLKCLEKDVSGRYATAGELAADLRRFLAGAPVSARRIGRGERTLRWARRNRAVTALMATTLVTLLGGIIVSSIFAWRASDSLHDSLVQEARLTLEARKQGYGEHVRTLIDRARRLPTTHEDEGELRRLLTLSMGDFVAYRPLVIPQGSDVVTDIHLSDNGAELVAGTGDGRVLIYDAHTGQSTEAAAAIEDEESPAGRVWAVAMDAAGKQIVAADSAGLVRVLQRTGRQWSRASTLQLGDEPGIMILSRHGTWAVIGSASALDVWDVARGERIQSLKVDPRWWVASGAIDEAGRLLAVSLTDNEADQVGWAVWNIDNGKIVKEATLPSLGGSYFRGLDLASGGNRMAVGFDEALLVYELPNFERTSFFGLDATKAVAFCPANSLLAATNSRGAVTIWNAATNREIAALTHPVTIESIEDLKFSENGRTLAACNHSSLQIWDLSRARERTVLKGHSGPIAGAAFRPDGKLLATAGADDEVRLWDPATGTLNSSLPIGEKVQSVAFSADGKHLLVGSQGRTETPHLRLVEIATGKILHEQDTGFGDVNSLAWDDQREAGTLAACGDEGMALWRVSLASSEPITELMRLSRAWCLAVALNVQGSTVAWANDGNHVKAWDLAADRDLPVTAPPMQSGWHGLSFLPDGDTIAYIAESGVAELWNVRTDVRVATLGTPGTFFASHMAISPDGSLLAAMTRPEVVSVWHVPTRKHIFSLRVETGAVWSFAWDPRGEQLAVGQSDGGLVIWRLPMIQQKLSETGLEWGASE